MKIVILESLGISDKELNIISKPLTDEGHELVVYDDGKLDDETIKDKESKMIFRKIFDKKLVDHLKLDSKSIKEKNFKQYKKVEEINKYFPIIFLYLN